MASENTASNDFLSFVNSINAFDCCLSGVLTLIERKHIFACLQKDGL